MREAKLERTSGNLACALGQVPVTKLWEGELADEFERGDGLVGVDVRCCCILTKPGLLPRGVTGAIVQGLES